jgi:hypothetical protein
MISVDIPGHDLLNKGWRDLQAKELSEEALLVLIGAPKLRAIFGDAVFAAVTLPDSPEHLLFSKLEVRLGTGAHSAYNALIRRLVSAEHALEGQHP